MNDFPNLDALSEDALKQLIRYSLSRGDKHKATVALRSLYRKAPLIGVDISFLDWTQTEVDNALEPFEEIASSVPGNRTKPFVPAGGYKRKSKTHPDKMWVDAYSRIQTPIIDAIFSAQIKEPGDNVEFSLTINRGTRVVYSPRQLEDSLIAWRDIAERAKEGAPL